MPNPQKISQNFSMTFTNNITLRGEDSEDMTFGSQYQFTSKMTGIKIAQSYDDLVLNMEVTSDHL
jgi:hypothetical protein